MATNAEWDGHEQEQERLAPPEAGAETQPQTDSTEDGMLTSRQQRALLYISRRHMRRPRITSRPPHESPSLNGNRHQRVRRNLSAGQDSRDQSPPQPQHQNEHPALETPYQQQFQEASEADTTIIVPQQVPTVISAGHESEQMEESVPLKVEVNGHEPEEPVAPEKTRQTADEERKTLAQEAVVIEKREQRGRVGAIAAKAPVPATQATRIRRTGQLSTVSKRARPAAHIAPPPPMPPLTSKVSKARTSPLSPPVLAVAPYDANMTRQRRVARKVRLRRKMLRHYSRKHLRQARLDERRSRLKLWLSILSTAFSLLIIVSSLVGTGITIAYHFYSQTQQKYQGQVLRLEDLLPLDNLKMYDSKGVLIGQMADQGLHTTVTFNQIAPTMQEATVATEDKNFWTNGGVDLTRILRAALDDVRSGRVVEGGSTITQQLIKNLIVGDEVTLERKLEEIMLTPDLNSHYSKQDILSMYLNSIYYGHQAYGIDAAAQVYFGLRDQPGKPAAKQLDLAQSAMLAGIPSSPYAYDPLLHPQAGMNRFETVLEAMIAQGYITRVQAQDAIQEAQSPNFFKPAGALNNRAPHFFNFVLLQLEKQFHMTREQLSRSGMQVSTTLDVALQDKIQKIAQWHIAELRDTHHVTNAAEVLIDYHTGAIISLLGSIDYNNASIDGQFDVATQGYRQPGSSFKPYVYVTAFQQGASPAQAIDDAPTTIQLPPDSYPPTFTPHNYDLSYHGHMTLRCALQNSLNVPAVKVLQHVGIGAAMQTARNMGITSYEGTPGYSLVLGGLSVRLIDHTSAMGVFANGGVRVGYYAINKVVLGNTGKVLYQHRRDPGKRVISPQLAYLMTSILSDNTDRIPEFFDCNVLQLYSHSQSACYAGNRGAIRPAAAKTGTTQNFRDNWTVGYTTDYVMGVWAGNDDNTPMYNVTGVQGAAPIWHDAMLVAEQGHPIRNFVNPGGLVRATVTYPDGVKTTDWFLPGTVPTFTTFNPSPIPTATPDGKPTPGPTPVPSPIPSRVPAYCPASYSFAFAPPPGNSSGNGWW